MGKQHILVGVLFNENKQVLVAQRPYDSRHGAGLWEFPGGKRETNESVEQALTRELAEELNITVLKARPLIRIHHDYASKSVLLDVWSVEQWQGQAWGKEGQLVEWCPLDNLRHKNFLKPNYPIITATGLPAEYLITPEPNQLEFHSFLYRLESCLDRGIRLVQFRAKQLSEKQFCHLAEQVLQLCTRYAAQLVLNATPEIALSVGAQGIHLTSERLSNCTERPLPYPLFVAASCHGIEDIEQANRIKTDFIVLSPVKPTLSHAKSPALGWFQFFQLTERAYCPVFALGNMTSSDLPKAWAHGAQGISAIRGIWEGCCGYPQQR